MSFRAIRCCSSVSTEKQNNPYGKLTVGSAETVVRETVKVLAITMAMAMAMTMVDGDDRTVTVTVEMTMALTALLNTGSAR